MHLIEGAFWSDGVPFTADDVIFTWEAYVVDTNVNASVTSMPGHGKGSPPHWKSGRLYHYVHVPCRKRWICVPAGGRHFPCHACSPTEREAPLWSTADPKPSYTDFANYPLQMTCRWLRWPWVITEYITDELMIMRRNPYYWKVDEAVTNCPI